MKNPHNRPSNKHSASLSLSIYPSSSSPSFTIFSFTVHFCLVLCRLAPVHKDATKRFNAALFRFYLTERTESEREREREKRSRPNLFAVFSVARAKVDETFSVEPRGIRARTYFCFSMPDLRGPSSVCSRRRLFCLYATCVSRGARTRFDILAA